MLTSKEDMMLVYGLYIGQKVRCTLLSGTRLTGTIIGVSNNGVHTAEYGVISFELCKLLLKPLSEISNEDAVEVAKLAGYNDCKGSNLHVHFREGHYRRWIDLQDFRVTDDRWNSDHEMDLPLNNVEVIIDFLRSRGYHLPYKGQSLYESGIAINSSENKDK